MACDAVRAGPSLSAEIKRAGPLPWQRAAEIGEQVAGALAEAHAAGIIHRDLKPDNILLAAGQRAIVTNFRFADAAEAATGPAGTEMIGTPGYMAPEQFDDRPASPATDMWALGATLYCATEGRPPFDGSTLAATIGAILAKPHDPPQHAGPLSGLIGSLLDKDPARRPDASAAARTLAGFRAATEPSQPPVSGSPEAFTAPPAGTPQDVIAPFGWPATPSAPATGQPQDAIAPFGWPSGQESAMAPGPRKRAIPWRWKAWAVPVAAIGAAAVITAVTLLLSSSPSGHPSASGGSASPRVLVSPSATAHLGATASAGAPTATPAPVISATHSAAPTHAAKPEPECSFVVGGLASCGSTNPQVRLYVNFGNDTTGCSFVRNIDWGDGKSSNGVVVEGGPAGPKYVTAHTYSKPGSYTIFFGGEVTAGDCNIVTPTWQFTLRSS